MTFEIIKKLGDWRAIRDCPGRFVLRGVPSTFGLADLIADGTTIRQFQSAHARDAVYIVCLEDGGIISYRQSAESWVHTLCTPEGFRRKLAQLEITL